ncbi:hypothetical protein FB45DRAFT_725093, partial [Roridomyces roridus]
LAGSIFGTVHCAAWNAHFVTAAEMFMWKVCSIIIVATPPIWFLYPSYFSTAARFLEYTARSRIRNYRIMMLAVSYVLARCVLVALAFTELRSLPPSRYTDVNSAAYI